MLRREQGRLGELEDTITRSVHEYPAIFRFRCALAHLHAELGNAAQARAALDALLARDLRNEYVDAEWLFSLAILADVCAFLADEEAAARLHEALLPYEDRYTSAPVEGVFGSVARALGVLATTAGRFDDAERHFAAAIEIERRMRATPWIAHVQHDHATMLLTRDAPGDRDRARGLLDEARATFESLGMSHWRERCDSSASPSSA